MKHHVKKIYTCIDCGTDLHNDVICYNCDSRRILTQNIVAEKEKPKRRLHKIRRLFKQLNLFDQKE